VAAVRFGLIGYGAWGSHHARAIAQTEGAVLVAVAARSPESRAAAQAAHPAVTTHADYRELLARADIDVVDVVLPSDLHLEVGQAVLAAGKQLLMEKPMALSVEGCRQLDALAQAQGKLLAVGFEMRLSELWGQVQRLIAAGAVGVPRYALMALWRRPYRPGSQGWRYDIRRVGNWVLEEPVHFFDLARWYFAPLGEPLSVYAKASPQRADHPELQDNFTALVAFPQDGHVVITQTLSAFEHHQVVQLTGTDGALWASWHGALDRDLHPAASLKHFDGKQVREVPLARPTGEVYELEDEIGSMVRAMRDGGPLAATGRDGIWSVALCQAAQESIASGGVVPLQAP
jgi:myo-inositol 2-dehydrogenase/D-chiro-inositol 1-dehydrogenase